MERPPNLIRDYGLSLLLALASVLLFANTMLPQIQRNRDLDVHLQQIEQRNRELLQQHRRLVLLEQAQDDPIVLERLFRLYHGAPADALPIELESSR